MKLKQIFIAGQEGMVGSALLNLLKKNNLKIINCKRKDLDLTNQDKVEKWFRKHKPDIVINSAGITEKINDVEYKNSKQLL